MIQINEQFVIYVRSKKGLKTWFPLNVVTGGSTANTLVKGLDSNLSKDVFSSLSYYHFSYTFLQMALKITDKQYWPGFIQRAGSVGRNGQKNANVEKCERT